MEENTDKQLNISDKPWQFKPGQSGNPAGRPKGKTLKEFARDLLMSMNDEEKKEYLRKLPKDIVWKMAEGNPHNTEDIDIGFKPQPIDDIQKDDSIQEDKETDKES